MNTKEEEGREEKSIGRENGLCVCVCVCVGGQGVCVGGQGGGVGGQGGGVCEGERKECLEGYLISSSLHQSSERHSTTCVCLLVYKCEIETMLVAYPPKMVLVQPQNTFESICECK